MNEGGQLPKLFVRVAWIVTLTIFAQGVCATEPNKILATDSVASAKSLSLAFRNAADRAAPGLVTVYTMRGPRMTAAWRSWLETTYKSQPMSAQMRFTASSASNGRDEQGSGIVIDRQGLIMTCNHVVAHADAMFVVLPDGRRFEPAEVRGDPITDLAVIRIEGAGDIAEVQLADSDGLQVGDWVISLANPYELKRSVSAGIVSATDRRVPGTPHSLIQNDAATNPGSSGGALLNLQGEVVGVVAGGFSTRQEFQGIGLAIPVNTAKRVVGKLQANGRIQRPYLGCHSQLLTPELAQQLELPVAGGLYVKDVADESPAETAGIEQGDIITHFAGQPIDATFRSEQLCEEPVPGQKYHFTLFRDGDAITVEVEMGQFSDEQPLEKTRPQLRSAHSSEHYDQSLGLGFDKLTPDLAQQLGFSKETRGILITDVVASGPAYKEGIAAGMVLLRINSAAIRNLDDYQQATRTSPAKKPVLMLIKSNEGEHLVVLETESPAVLPSVKSDRNK